MIAVQFFRADGLYLSESTRMSRQNKLTPGDDTETHPEQRPSILEKLHDKQAEISVCRKGPISTKEKSDDLSL